MGRDNIAKEIAIIIAVSILSFLLFSYFDILERIVEWSKNHEKYEIDEIVSTSIVVLFMSFIFSIRRWRETIEKEKILTKSNKEIQAAMDEIRQLRGILPLCSFCKKIRDDSGYWEQVDVYIKRHSAAEISHGICPECMKKNYPEEYAEIYPGERDETSLKE